MSMIDATRCELIDQYDKIYELKFVGGDDDSFLKRGKSVWRHCSFCGLNRNSSYFELIFYSNGFRIDNVLEFRFNLSNKVIFNSKGELTITECEVLDDIEPNSFLGVIINSKLCYNSVAVASEDMLLCKKLHSNPDGCKMSIAMKKEDKSLCKNIEDEKVESNCKLAIKKGNKPQKVGYRIDNCIDSSDKWCQAINSKDLNLCYDLTKTEEQMKCITDVAIVKGG